MSEFKKVNVRDVPEMRWAKEGRVALRKHISEALGRKPESTDAMERHPFDVEILRVPAHSIPYRYHSHSAQWEYYQVISGNGVVRHSGGTDEIAAGDAFIFKPNEAHQLRNDADEDLVVLVVADNPFGDGAYYPDDAMWLVISPERRYLALHPEREKGALP